MTRTDEELMGAVRDGNRVPLGILFERHHQRMHAFCFRMTQDPVASEDLVQEVFARILKYRRTFRSGATFSTWLYTLAHNACRDHFRRRSRESRVFETPGSLLHADGVAAPGPGPWQVMEQSQQLQSLRRSLLSLPPDKRAVLVLSRFEERPHAEIATILGCSVGAVKVRVHRAMRALQEAYIDQIEETVA